MRLTSFRLLAFASACAGLAGCDQGERRPEWRNEAERACLRSGAVVPSATIVQVDPIGSGVCGMNSPFRVSELPNSHVAISKPATMSCQMIPALDGWVANVVQPAAVKTYGSYVTQIETAGAYSCRRINGSPNLSEHAFGNAMDITGFKLADGRRVKVGKADVIAAAPHADDPFQASAQMREPQPRSDLHIAANEEWEQMAVEALENLPDDGEQQDQSFTGEQVVSAAPFLDAVRHGGCETFTTVLGPGQRDHDDHLHFDLARHYSGKHVCK